MPNIAEWRLKIKNVVEDALTEWGTIAIVLLLGIASFGLGRLSALEDAKPPVSVRMASAAASPRALFMGGLIVASKNGKNYYYPWCSGASKIAPANQLWFSSQNAARAAGFAAAKGCKGLE